MAGQQREFTVITDNNPDPPQIGIKGGKALPRHNIPNLALKPGHDLLVLMTDDTIRPEQNGTVHRARPCKNRGRGPKDQHIKPPGQFQMQGTDLRAMTCDLLQGALKIASNLAPPQ